jgi:hypothetical protein
MVATRIPRPSWGQFWSDVDQYPSAADAVNVVTLNNADPANSGVSVVDSSRVTFAYAGTYDVAFSTQVDRDSGAGTATVDIWPAVDGDDVPDSNTRVTLTGPARSAKIVAAWNWLVTVDAGGYVEIRWSTTDADIILHHEDPPTNPARPAIPSIIVTAVKVDE